MIKFGPAGNSQYFYAAGYKNTVQAAKFCKDLGLDCFEYPFGRGILMSEDKAIEIAQGKVSREEAVVKTEERLKILAEYIYLNGYEDLYFCPETMGKIAQIGTLEEVVRFCKIDKVFVPAVDFGHLNAREGGSLKTVDDYLCRLEYMISELGFERVKNFHVHFSKIMYGGKGEIKHLTFEDNQYGPEFQPLAIALKKLQLEPYIICESSGTPAEDALEMKQIYGSVDI